MIVVPVIVLSLVSVVLTNPYPNLCCNRDVKDEAIRSMYKFTVPLYKLAATRHSDHFVLSQYSVWFSLAALAEGATGQYQENLFSILGLPSDECSRKKYYEVIHNIKESGRDVRFRTERILAVDETVNLNKTWVDRIVSSDLLTNTTFVPIHSAPQEASERMAHLLHSRYPILDVDFSGNSALLSTFDYEGLWTTAFPDCHIEKNAAFYNEFGVRVGYVDLLRMTARVKLTLLPKLNTKVLQLPVGENGRYKFVFVQNIDAAPIQKSVGLLENTIILDILDNAQESKIPLEIAVPRFKMESQHDGLRYLLEELGVHNIWSNPEASAFVSTPPALPTAIVQRVSITIGSGGIEPYYAPPNDTTSQTETGLATILGRDFISNRPFLFALIDSESRSTLFAGAFSKPYLNLY